MVNSNITTSVSGNSVTMYANISPADGVSFWGIYVYAHTDHGLGSGGTDPNYTYLVERINGSGTGTYSYTRTYSNDQYVAQLALQGMGVVDYSLFTIGTPPPTTYIIHWSAIGNGKIAVSLNGSFVDYVIGGMGTKTFTFHVGDSVLFQAIPDPGWVFDATCFSTGGCDSTNPYSGTITTPMEVTYTSNFSKPTCTNPKYKCSGTSCISDNCDGTGTFTTNTCNNTCNPTCTNPKYKCSGATCISDNCDGTGIFISNNCNLTCTAPPPTQCPGCDTTKNYCIAGSCIQKSYVLLGAAGFLALSVLRG